MTLVKGEAALGKKKGEDDVSWTDMNLRKIKKIHTVDSVGTNRR
jgi:hypothetical protein